MADVVTRFRLETTQFDSKLRDTSKDLHSLVKEMVKAGQGFNAFSEADIEAARSLGTVQSGATNTKDKLKDLVGAFNDAAKAYNMLDEEAKRSEFGQALSDSLKKLQKDIKDTKQELYGVGDAAKSVGQGGELTGFLDRLKEKFSVNIDAFKLFDVGLKAVKGALDVAKSAIESNEASHDSLARTMAVTDSVTNQFLHSLATADFSNFISGLQGIIDKATEAYNAMDEFESFAARFQPWQQAKEAEIQTKMAQARAARSQGDINRAESLTNEAKRLIDELSSSTKAYGEKQATAGFATIKNLMGAVDISNEQIAWYADPNNWEEAKKRAQAFLAVQEKIDKLGNSSITATSYDQTTRRQNREEIQKLEAELRRNPHLKQAYTMMNLRDSGDSDQAQQFREALNNIYGNTLAESRIESLRARAERIEGVLMNASNRTTGGSTGSKQQVKIETQQNTELIQKLTTEYQALADAAKIADEAQQGRIKDRMTAIRSEIGQLKERNDELKRFADEASRIKYPTGSLPELAQRLMDLQDAQSKALNNQQWTDYQKSIEQTQYQIDAIKNKWKEGLQATFTLKAEQPKAVEVMFKADDSDVLEKVRDIDGVSIDDKTLTVTANTSDAIYALRQIEGLTIKEKNVEVLFHADDADVLSKVRDIDGVTIDDKTLTVTANTQEAVAALAALDGLTIQPKTATVTFLADDADVLSKVRDIEGVTIDDKTLMVTADTADAIYALGQVEGLTIQDKTVDVVFKANDADVLDVVREIDGVTIDDKTLTVTANTQEAVAALARIEGLTIQDKTVDVSMRDDSDVLAKLREIDGVQIDEKSLTVTADTAEAYNKVNTLLEGIEDTTVEFVVKPKMAKGLNGFNSKTMGWLEQTRKADLSNAEYGSQEYQDISANLTDINTIKTLVEQTAKAGITAAQVDMAPFWEKVFDGQNISDDEWQGLVDNINEHLQSMDLEPITIDFQTGNLAKDGKTAKESWQEAANAVSAVGNALRGIEDPTAKIIGLIGQAVANIALGFAQATAKTGATSGVFGWIAAVATGIGTMVSTINAIHSATGYADGGIIKGNSYSGDNIPADSFVNAGELILNRAQQTNVAGLITAAEQGSGQGGYVKVNGEQLLIPIFSTLKRQGYAKGEYIKIG